MNRLVNENEPIGSIVADPKYFDRASHDYRLQADSPCSLLGASTVVSPPLADLAPDVSVTAPTTGATFTSSVNMAASASDDVSVAKVEFLVDGKLRGTDYSAPYALTWSVPKRTSYGQHTLTARGYDNAGLTTTSEPVSVTRVH